MTCFDTLLIYSPTKRYNTHSLQTSRFICIDENLETMLVVLTFILNIKLPNKAILICLKII